jgi:hypothetical protein
VPPSRGQEVFKMILDQLGPCDDENLEAWAYISMSVTVYVTLYTAGGKMDAALGFADMFSKALMRNIQLSKSEGVVH